MKKGQGRRGNAPMIPRALQKPTLLDIILVKDSDKAPVKRLSWTAMFTRLSVTGGKKHHHFRVPKEVEK